MVRNLTTQERIDLQRSHKKERDGRIRDRIKAVLLYDKDYSYSEIAEILLLDDETIRRHIKDYFSSHKLIPENGGSHSHLTVKQTKKLKSHLQEKTYLYVKDICAYVKKTFGVNYSISGMTKWLQANNFRYKKPHGVPAKADKDKQAAFIEYYEALKKKAGNKEPIYFGDSVHPQHQTHLVQGWILKGERKAIATTARQKRVNYIGALTLSGHRLTYQKTDKVNTESIIGLMKKLRTHHPGKHKLHLIWDNAGYHRSQKVQDKAKALKIELHYLPPYSPNLNPIERLWKIMHEHVSYNKYYDSFLDFSNATAEFFRHVAKKKKLLRLRITDNFQTIQPPSFAF